MNIINEINYKVLSILTLIICILVFIMAINPIPILNIIIILLFLTYLLLINEKKVVLIQLIYMFFSTFILDNLWIKTNYDINMYLKYMNDIINYILILKIIIKHKKYKSCLKDNVIITWLIIITIGFFNTIVNRNSFIEYLFGIRIYMRFIPMYIIVRLNDFKLENIKKIYYFLFIFQFITTILETFRYTDQDMRSGTFGVYGTIYLLLFMSIILGYLIYSYINKKTSYVNLLVNLSIVIYMTVVAEIKMLFILFPVIVIILIIFSNRSYFVKRGILIISVLVIVISGFNILGSIFPQFKNMFSNNFIENYVIQNNNPLFIYGRVENFKIINDYELINLNQKLYGIGIGSALPKEHHYYDYFSKGRQFLQLPGSKYFDIQQDTGYFISSLNILLYETGYLGLILYAILIISSISVLKKETNNEITKEKYNADLLNYILIGVAITWIAGFIYSDFLYNVQTNYMFMGVIALKKSFSSNYLKHN